MHATGTALTGALLNGPWHGGPCIALQQCRLTCGVACVKCIWSRPVLQRGGALCSLAQQNHGSQNVRIQVGGSEGLRASHLGRMLQGFQVFQGEALGGLRQQGDRHGCSRTLHTSNPPQEGQANSRGAGMAAAALCTQADHLRKAKQQQQGRSMR